MTGQSDTSEVLVQRDIRYGRGIVSSTTAPSARSLTLDLYRARSQAVHYSRRPALALAFGGAFHRGSKENDSFEVDGRRNTAIAAYCEAFARRGYVCAAVQYRLTPEDPDPAPSGCVADPVSIPRSRIDEVRRLLGLGPATAEMLWRGVEAAANDLDAAISYLRNNASSHGIDPERIAVGGWSAGARTALNVAFAKRAGVRAVISLSGFMATTDIQRLVARDTSAPAVFLAWGERDLDYVRTQGPIISASLMRAGLDVETVELPGETHFYDKTAATGAQGISLEEAMATFLDSRLGAMPPTRRG